MEIAVFYFFPEMAHFQRFNPKIDQLKKQLLPKTSRLDSYWYCVRVDSYSDEFCDKFLPLFNIFPFYRLKLKPKSRKKKNKKKTVNLIWLFYYSHSLFLHVSIPSNLYLQNFSFCLYS